MPISRYVPEMWLDYAGFMEGSAEVLREAVACNPMRYHLNFE